MRVLASLFGSGVGLVVIALAVLIGRHYRHLPLAAHEWAGRLVIVLMYAGGSAVAVTQLGAWMAAALRWLASLLGGLDAGLPRAMLVISCMFVLASLAVSLTVAPAPRAGMVAAVMPLILSLARAGFLHQVDLATTIPARAFAALVAAWLGG